MIYELHWKFGKKERIEGDTIEEAFTNAGFSAGALRALDYYNQVENLPIYEKYICDDEGDKIHNPAFVDQIKNQSFDTVGKTVVVDYANRLFTYSVDRIGSYRIYFKQTSMTLKPRV